jgi:hypothetical protein
MRFEPGRLAPELREPSKDSRVAGAIGGRACSDRRKWANRSIDYQENVEAFGGPLLPCTSNILKRKKVCSESYFLKSCFGGFP